jgi:solute carrier family 35 protein C2
MTEFHLFGFMLCLSAAACGGLRWTLSQVLTQKKELGLGNPIDAIYHLQPVMVIAMAPLLISHGLLPFLTTENLFAAPTFSDLMPNFFLLLIGAIFAFALGLTEYLLVAKTSR